MLKHDIIDVVLNYLRPINPRFPLLNETNLSAFGIKVYEILPLPSDSDPNDKIRRLIKFTTNRLEQNVFL